MEETSIIILKAMEDIPEPEDDIADPTGVAPEPVFVESVREPRKMAGYPSGVEGRSGWP